MAGNPFLLELPSNNVIDIGDASEFTIGRSVNSSLDIKSTYVSRNQCVIKKVTDEDKWVLIDLSSYRTTTLNDESMKGETVVLNDGDRICFLNFREKEFIFFSSREKLSNIHKKRKHSDIIEESVLTPTQESKHRKEKFLERCTILEKENQKLNDRLKYLNVLSENTQKSLALLETENKTLRDRLQEEERSRELLLIKLNSVEESLKESEAEREKLQSKNTPKENVSAEADIFCEDPDLNNMLTEEDYYQNFDYASTPESVVEVKDPPPCPRPTEILYDYISDAIAEREEEKKKMVFMEAENAALTRELQKKDLLVTAAIREKETFRTNILDALEHELPCGVCSEILYQPITLNCRHTFCKVCVDEWKKKKKECPVCRAKIKIEVPTLVLDSFIDKAAEILGEEFKERREEVKKERKMKKPSPPKKAKKRSQSRRMVPVPATDIVVEILPGVLERHMEVINLDLESNHHNTRRARTANEFDVIDLTSSPRPSTSRRYR